MSDSCLDTWDILNSFFKAFGQKLGWKWGTGEANQHPRQAVTEFSFPREGLVVGGRCLCLILKKLPRCFPAWLYHFNIPPAIPPSQPLHTLAAFCAVMSFGLFILAQCHPAGVLFCFPLMAMIWNSCTCLPLSTSGSDTAFIWLICCQVRGSSYQVQVLYQVSNQIIFYSSLSHIFSLTKNFSQNKVFNFEKLCISFLVLFMPLSHTILQ